MSREPEPSDAELFDIWIEDLKLALIDWGYTASMAREIDREAWRRYYEDCYTPDEAAATIKSLRLRILMPRSRAEMTIHRFLFGGAWRHYNSRSRS